MADGKLYKIKLKDDQILILTACHNEKLASTKDLNQDLLKDWELSIEAGKANCKWCKKEVPYPEVRIKVFE